MEKKLPKDFFWGGSVSSFQTEGAWRDFDSYRASDLKKR